MQLKKVPSRGDKSEIINSFITNEPMYCLNYSSNKKIENKIIKLKKNSNKKYDIFKYLDEGKLIKAIILETGCTKKFLINKIKKVKKFISNIKYLKFPSHTYKAKGKLLINIPCNEILESYCNSIIPALLSGNKIIIKPSRKAALSVYLLYKATQKAGAKQQICFLPLKKAQLEFLVKNKIIDAIHWTGGYSSAHKVGANCLKYGVGFNFDSEGNDWAFVNKDVNIKKVSSLLINNIIENNGLMCNSIQGIFIHKKKYVEFLSYLQKAFDKINVGDPFNLSSDVGKLSPLVIKKLDYQLKNSKYEKSICNKNDYNNHYPKLIINPIKDQIIVLKESFGPILWIKKVSSEDICIDWFRNNNFGLNFTIFCKNVKLIKKLIVAVNVARYNINSNPLNVSMFEPWGGIKFSGNNGVTDWVEKFTNRIYIKKL